MAVYIVHCLNVVLSFHTTMYNKCQRGCVHSMSKYAYVPCGRKTCISESIVVTVLLKAVGCSAIDKLGSQKTQTVIKCKDSMTC